MEKLPNSQKGGYRELGIGDSIADLRDMENKCHWDDF
jgi:hypothetical protein